MRKRAIYSVGAALLGVLNVASYALKNESSDAFLAGFIILGCLAIAEQVD